MSTIKVFLGFFAVGWIVCVNFYSADKIIQQVATIILINYFLVLYLLLRQKLAYS